MVLRQFYKLLFLCVLCVLAPFSSLAQSIAISGRILSQETGEPLEFATICETQTRLWTVSDAQGSFILTHLPSGNNTLEVRIFGYRTKNIPFFLTKDTLGINILMCVESLKLDSVIVTATQVKGTSTSSYIIERSSLDHLQILNASDITALLPGGKTGGNLSLMSDQRIALRSQSSLEMGNQSFGTAIEVDGIRMQQNGQMSLSGSSTRTIAPSSIASIEVITGIPSVEYGDLSNGMVRIHTRQTQSPYIIEFITKPHTKVASLCKGWQLHSSHGNWGILNASLEHAQSVSNLTSPYTTYQRNVITLSYNRSASNNLRVSSTISGNIGGYNSKSDPDAFTDTWTRERDNMLRGKIGIDWQPDKNWISRMSIEVSGSFADQQNEAQTNTNTASAQPQIHVTEQGYHVASDYDSDPTASIILSPIGYWYRRSVTDNRPYSLTTHIKGEWNRLHEFQSQISLATHFKTGIHYEITGNDGRGLYYPDSQLAPTWRESRYDTMPSQHTLSAFVEEHLSLSLKHSYRVSLTCGLREDLTMVSASEYGTSSALSPRVSGRIESTDGSVFHQKQQQLSLFGGWGKSVKLPSMQVLYPSTSYSDQLAFAPGTTADGHTYYAFYTHPSRAIYNSNLRWQYSIQGEVGIEYRIRGTRVTLSGYRAKTLHPYLATMVFSPYSYRFTSQGDLQNSLIPSADREYSIDQESGIVTVSDRTGSYPDEVLSGTIRQSYLSNTKYVNGSSSLRMGLEWVIDFARIPVINTDIRIDGQLTRYKGIETTLVASRPSSTLTMANGQPYAYIGYYEGSTTPGNGQLTRQLNTNVTFTTHIPVVRLICSVRLEATFMNYSRRLQSHPLSDDGMYGTLYPIYYSTWDEPDKLLPYEEHLLKAKVQDPELYQELYRLVSYTNTDYFFKSNRISPYLCGNLNITKEIGDHISISFQATNFWNNTGTVYTSQTDRKSTLYGSGYIPSFYYGLSMRIKI